MSSTSILVLGAGELGLSILTSLATHPSRIKQDTKITMLLRPLTIDTKDPDKKARNDQLRSFGISFLPSDLASAPEAELIGTFKPFDTIIVTMGYEAGEGTQRKITRAVIAAAKEQKMNKRYFPFQFGVDYDLIGTSSAQELMHELLEVRKMLRAEIKVTSREDSGVDWTIVSTGMFTSFLFEEFFGVVNLGAIGEGKDVIVRALGGWDNRVTVTTPEDIGRITAEIVYGPFEDETRNKIVYTASDTVSYQDVASIVQDVLDVQVKKELWDMAELERALKEDPEDRVKKYRVVFGKGVGVSWDKSTSFNARHGIEVQGVRDFAERNLKR